MRILERLLPLSLLPLLAACGAQRPAVQVSFLQPSAFRTNTERFVTQASATSQERDIATQLAQANVSQALVLQVDSAVYQAAWNAACALDSAQRQVFADSLRILFRQLTFKQNLASLYNEVRKFEGKYTCLSVMGLQRAEVLKALRPLVYSSPTLRSTYDSGRFERFFYGN